MRLLIEEALLFAVADFEVAVEDFELEGLNWNIVYTCTGHIVYTISSAF